MKLFVSGSVVWSSSVRRETAGSRHGACRFREVRSSSVRRETAGTGVSMLAAPGVRLSSVRRETAGTPWSSFVRRETAGDAGWSDVARMACFISVCEEIVRLGGRRLP